MEPERFALFIALTAALLLVALLPYLFDRRQSKRKSVQSRVVNDFVAGFAHIAGFTSRTPGKTEAMVLAGEVDGAPVELRFLSALPGFVLRMEVPAPKLPFGTVVIGMDPPWGREIADRMDALWVVAEGAGPSVAYPESDDARAWVARVVPRDLRARLVALGDGVTGAKRTSSHLEVYVLGEGAVDNRPERVPQMVSRAVALARTLAE